MVNRNISQNIDTVVALKPQTISTSTTTSGPAIDLRGYDSAMIHFIGNITDGTYTPLIEESATGSFGGEENAVADADLEGTEAAAALSTDTDKVVDSKIGYKGTKRYIRARLVSTSVATTGGILAASAILGNPANAPVTNDGDV